MQIKKGDLIIRSKPFIYRLSKKYRNQRCDNCLKSHPSLRKCSKCKLSAYCDRDCQIARWADHKFECKAANTIKMSYAMFGESVTDLALQIANIHLKEQRDHKESETVGNVTRTFADLESHSKEILEEKSNSAHEKRVMAKTTHKALKNFGISIEYQEFIEIFGKLIINSLCIVDMVTGEQLGNGLYLGPSMFNHSCRANAFYTNDGPYLKVHSAMDHDEFHPENVFVPYINIFKRKEIRQRALLQQYFFLCKCPGCEDESLERKIRSMRCSNENCDEPVFIERDGCPKCGSTISESSRNHARALNDQLEAFCEADRKPSDHKLEELCNVMKTARPVLHPLNVALVNCAQEAMDICIEQDDYGRALIYALDTLPGCREYWSDMHPNLVSHLTKIGGLQQYIGDHDSGNLFLKEALQMAIKVFGPDAAFTVNIRERLS